MSRWRDWALAYGLPAAVIFALLAIWQWLPPSVIPVDLTSRPTEVVSRLVELFTSGEVLNDLWATTKQVLIGTIIGGTAGVLLALFSLAIPRHVRLVVNPVVEIGYSIPKPVLISLFILWLGIDDGTKIALVVSFVFFIFYFNAREGLASVSHAPVEALALMGASRLQIWRLYYLPALRQHLVAALRLALPLAYSAAVFADLTVSGREGLGVLINRAFAAVDPAGVLAIVLLIGIIGVVIDVILVAYLHRRGQETSTAVAR